MTDIDFRPLSDEDFVALARHPNGDIVDLWVIHPLLTDEQRLEFSPDDADWVEAAQLSDTGLLSDDLVEFGICSRMVPHFDREFEEAA